jgi:hypothetical protein
MRQRSLRETCRSERLAVASAEPRPPLARIHLDRCNSGSRRNGHEEEQDSKSPSQLIDERIKELGDWRGKMLSRLRTLVKEADPEVVEEWKWRGVPVWSHDGMICTGETYKNSTSAARALRLALQHAGARLVRREAIRRSIRDNLPEPSVRIPPQGMNCAILIAVFR